MRRERGSVLLLVPAGLVVVFILAAIAVDAAVVFLAQRELVNAAAAAANDAATAVDEGTFYGGAVALDHGRAVTTAVAAVAARRPLGIEIESSPDVAVDATAVTVVLRGRVRPPLGGRVVRMSARARAVARARG